MQVRRGCERNVITYSSLISACEKAGRWQLALELFSEMHREGCKPNVVTYNSLIAACAQGEGRDAASPGPSTCLPVPRACTNLLCHLSLRPGWAARSRKQRPRDVHFAGVVCSGALIAALSCHIVCKSNLPPGLPPPAVKTEKQYPLQPGGCASLPRALPCAGSL